MTMMMMVRMMMLMRVTVNLVHFLCVSRCTALPFFFLQVAKASKSPNDVSSLIQHTAMRLVREGRAETGQSAAPQHRASRLILIYIYIFNRYETTISAATSTI